MCDITPTYVWHDSYISVTWLIHRCDTTCSYVCGMTHTCVWHDSCIHVTYLLHMCDMTHTHVWHDSYTCVTWLIHMYDMTFTYVWRDSYMCVTWLIHMCDMNHTYVWHDFCICVTWLTCVCDKTHSHIRHDSFIYVIWLIYTWDSNHTHVWHDSFIPKRKKKEGKEKNKILSFFLLLKNLCPSLKSFPFALPWKMVYREKEKWKKCPPKNGLNALWSATNPWYVVKCVSQKRNWSNNKHQWYNILITFILKFS